MRLKEIKHILGFIDLETFSLKFRRIDGKSGYVIHNINKFKEFIDIARHLPFFKDEVNAILESNIYATSQDAIDVNFDTSHSISKNANYLANAVMALVRVLPKILPEENDQSLNIKLPCPNDFETLINSTLGSRKS